MASPPISQQTIDARTMLAQCLPTVVYVIGPTLTERLVLAGIMLMEISQ